ncbi:MAG TPA: TonB-dependent receptor [Prolixibacteraceae bacterium]|nr:TonB-dependent receptor [Prolixibacteraceae bacterium]
MAPIADQFAPFEWQAILGASFIRSSSTSLHYNMAGGTIAPRKGSLTADGISPLTEMRIQHDLGLRIHTEKQDEFSASMFFTSRKDAIDLSGKTVTTGNNLLMELYENLDKRSYGLEMSAKITIPFLHSGLFANALFMKGEKESVGKMMKDRQLPQIILNGGFNFQYAGFDANLYVNYTGRYWNNRFVNPAWVKQNGDFPLGNFVSADWSCGYTFSGKLKTRIFAEVKNILDQKYMTVAGYPEPGRLLSVGMKLFF